MSVFFRKAKTLSLTLVRCSNGFTLALHKLNVLHGPTTVKLRGGPQIRTLGGLRETWGEVFEPAIADIYEIRNANPDCIVDIGANIGAFACLAALTHPHAAIHAFEPSKEHAQALRENIALNDLRNVEVHLTPVTTDGRVVRFSKLGDGGASGIIMESEDFTEMPSVSLDVLDLQKIRSLFIKLDCEGAEGEILCWICSNIRRLPPHIQIACEYHHWCPISLEKLVADLRTAGFRVSPEVRFGEQYIFAHR